LNLLNPLEQNPGEPSGTMQNPAEPLLDYCVRHDAWVRETIERLVRLESPSTDKAAVDRCGAAIEELLVSLGGHVRRLRQHASGDHLRAEWGDGLSQVLLLGHFDTVWPVGQLERMPLRRTDGRLHGPGVFDMKAGIGVAMLAVRALRAVAAAPLPRIVMLWTTDEEIGSPSSRDAIEEEARRSAAVLVLEPSLPGGGAKTSRKGVGEFELAVHGVPAHAGVDPGKGASAISEIARQIVAIEALQDLPRGISVNVGRVEGGSRPNVVAEHASAKIDVRVPTLADAARIDAALRGLQPQIPGTRLELSGGIERPPFERTPGVARLYELAREAAAQLGQELPEGGTGGASDGNFTGALGVPTLDGLGPKGDGAHARHEHVVEADLAWRAALVATIVTRLHRQPD
jgi:glutamate carboxypeptidase